MPSRCQIFFVLALFLCPRAVAGQTPQPPPDQAPATVQAADQVICAGCPKRRLGTSFLLVTVVNGFYELANLIRGQDTAKITPSTWWLNMKRGWEWDLDDFVVNQIGHPYQGNNYFTSGRSLGLNFWESAGLTAFGSGTWEYFGETNQASLNDFINTTLGGIALGEMFHRTAWLVRNTTLTGKSRLTREILAMAIDPMSGVVRFTDGDSSRVVEKPRDMVPSKLGAFGSVGALWRGSNTETIASDAYAFFETDLLYGDLFSGSSRTPYDAFAVRLSFGGGSPLSEARVRGRLLSKPVKGTLASISQSYKYLNNPAYQYGAQSFEMNVIMTNSPASRTQLVLAGWGGVTVLGAVDSIPLTGKVEDEQTDAGQGVSTGPRYYDYGPGGNLGALFTIQRDARPIVSVSWELSHLHVLDGVRANHMLQRARADLTVPIKGGLGIGTSAEYFDRRTYYADHAGEAHFRFPQFRVFLTWLIS